LDASAHEYRIAIEVFEFGIDYAADLFSADTYSMLIHGLGIEALLRK